MPVSFNKIRPLVASAQRKGDLIHVNFRCPVSGRHWIGVARADAPWEGGFWNRARTNFQSMMLTLWGQEHEGFVPDENIPAEAVVAAFVQVERFFAWDEGRQAYVAAAVAYENPFMAAVRASPIDTASRAVLARMMRELAHSDGTLEDPELAWIKAWVKERPPAGAEISETELKTIPESQRKAVMLLARASALCDAEVEEQELERLHRWEGWLGLDSAELAVLSHENAMEHVLDAVYLDNTVTETEQNRISSLAARWNITPERLSELQTRYRQRHGIR